MSQDSSGTVDGIVQELDAEKVKAARDADINVEEIVGETMQEYADYEAVTQARFASAALERALDAVDAEVHEGILLGSRDRSGKNWPRRLSLVKKDGDHMEISSWSGSIPMDDGTEVDLPHGEMVEIAAEHDAEYDSWEAKRLDAVTRLSQSERASRLASVAVPPREIARDDEYEVVVVRGTVAWVDPATVFEDGEPVGDGPIMAEDENGELKPHLEVSLEGDEGVRVRGRIEEQRYGNPYIDVTDFDKLIRDANENFGEPEAQTEFLNSVMQGTDVVLVGNVSKVNQTRQDGAVVTYVSLGLSGIVEVPSGAGQASSSEAATESTSDTDTDTDSGAASASDVDAIREDIEQYADLTGTALDTITPSFVQDNLDVDAPESVIHQALDELRGVRTPSDAAEQESTDGDSDAPEQEPLESLQKSDGTYSCPKGGCLFSGSEASLYGHAASEHAGEQDPREWVMDNA